MPNVPTSKLIISGDVVSLGILCSVRRSADVGLISITESSHARDAQITAPALDVRQRLEQGF